MDSACDDGGGVSTLSSAPDDGGGVSTLSSAPDDDDDAIPSDSSATNLRRATGRISSKVELRT